MDRKEYRDKLLRFNSTEKYFTEMDFLYGLIQAYPFQTIIDYGCGAGTMAKWLRNVTEKTDVLGFDVINYVNEKVTNKPVWFIDEMQKCDTLYFFHSFAHIPNVSRILLDIREKVKKKVIVITPNAQWLNLQRDENYKPDPTVVMHYTHDELVEVFEDTGYKVQISGGFGVKCNNQYERLFLVAKP